MTGLTKKEKGFVNEYIKTGHGTESALKVYDTDDRDVAGVIASQNLGKLKIQQAIAERLSDDLLEEKHLALLNKTDKKYDSEGNIISEEIDVQAVAKGLDMAYKVKGSYAPDKNINLNVTMQPIDPTNPSVLSKLNALQEELENND